MRVVVVLLVGLTACGRLHFADADRDADASRAAGDGIEPGTADGRGDASTSNPPADAVVLATEVTSSTMVTMTGWVDNHATQLWVATTTLTNIGATTIDPPISLVLDALTATVTGVDADGTTTYAPPLGSPYFNATTAVDPGQQVMIMIIVSNPTNGFIDFTPRVLAGAGAR